MQAFEVNCSYTIMLCIIQPCPEIVLAECAQLLPWILAEAEGGLERYQCVASK
jgi:hypothetical protein